MNYVAILLMACFVFHGTAFSTLDGRNAVVADTSPGDSILATFTLNSNPQGAQVYIDSLLIGRTPLDSQRIPPGTHVLRFVHANYRSWLAPMVTETLTVPPGAHLTRTWTFPTIYVVKSEPYGATVRYRDSSVGTTPYILCASQKEVIALSKDGYEDEIIVLTPEGGELFARMRSLVRTPAGESPLVASGEKSKNLFPVFLTSGTTILTGVASAYFKMKADGRYNDYRLSGDAGTLDEVHRFDRLSGIALVTSELSLIALSYFLLSR